MTYFYGTGFGFIRTKATSVPSLKPGLCLIKLLCFCMSVCPWVCVSVAFRKGSTVLMEPIMSCEFSYPKEFNKNVLALISKRRGVLNTSELQDDYMVVDADVSPYEHGSLYMYVCMCSLYMYVCM